MTQPKSMSGIFHDLSRNRAEKATAPYRFVVVSLTSKRVPATVSAQDLRFNGTLTREAAEARKQAMERMNPTKQFVILAR